MNKWMKIRLLFAKQCDQYADVMPVCQEVTPCSLWRDATGRPALGQGPNKSQRREKQLWWNWWLQINREVKLTLKFPIFQFSSCSCTGNNLVQQLCSKPFLCEDWCPVRFRGVLQPHGSNMTHRSLKTFANNTNEMAGKSEVPPSSETIKRLSTVTLWLMAGLHNNLLIIQRNTKSSQVGLLFHGFPPLFIPASIIRCFN